MSRKNVFWSRGGRVSVNHDQPPPDNTKSTELSTNEALPKTDITAKYSHIDDLIISTKTHIDGDEQKNTEVHVDHHLGEI